jgi:tetratricopeptide (TPR) repeat protein
MRGYEVVAQKCGPPIALAASDKDGLALLIGEPIERLVDGEIAGRQRVAKMCGQQKRNIIHTSSTAYEQDHSAAAHSPRAATRADPMFAEAWYNLSDLLDEQGRSEAAIDCLRRALQAPRTTPTRCLISRSCFSETTGRQRRRRVGGAIWPTTLNLNGQHERGVR